MDPTQRRGPIEVALPEYGVFVLESHHAPGFRMTEQRHDFFEVFYVLDGGGAFQIEGEMHSCGRKDVVVVPTGQAHCIEDDLAAPLALYGICVAPRVWRNEPSLLEHLCGGRLCIGTAIADQVRSDLRRLLFEQANPRVGSKSLILGLTLQILAVLGRSNAMARPKSRGTSPSGHRLAMERYVAELPHRFFEATDLDHAADELAMSRRRFTSLFRTLTGASWSEYLGRLRIEYACQLLRDNSRSITATAFECGYEDLSSFYRAFKRARGLPPKAWRDRQKQS